VCLRAPIKIEIGSGSSLPAWQCDEVRNLCAKYSDIFQLPTINTRCKDKGIAAELRLTKGIAAPRACDAETHARWITASERANVGKTYCLQCAGQKHGRICYGSTNKLETNCKETHILRMHYIRTGCISSKHGYSTKRTQDLEWTLR